MVKSLPLWLEIVLGKLWFKKFDTFGRSAIQEMVVRGAPAIAIAAALSLAVEVFNFHGFDGSASDAVAFLENKLDYLVSRLDFGFVS